MAINNIIHTLDFSVKKYENSNEVAPDIFRFDSTLKTFDSTNSTFDEN